MDPYYTSGKVTLYHGRHEEILPYLCFDSIVTDPPYPGSHETKYNYYDGILKPLALLECPQAIFWTPSAAFPLDWQGLHAWDKATGSNTQFELIYFRGIRSGYKVHRFMSPHNAVRAKISGDAWTTHPSQKPVQLMRRLIGEMKHSKVICDPFAGSGSTLVACKMADRGAIGIEMNKQYCEVIIERLEQCC